MPFDGIPPYYPSPAVHVVENMLTRLATRDHWLRNREVEYHKDGSVQVCLRGAFKLALQLLPWRTRRSVGTTVLRSLNVVLSETITDARYPNYGPIIWLTRWGMTKTGLMMLYNDDPLTSYLDVIATLHKTRARLLAQPVTVAA